MREMDLRQMTPEDASEVAELIYAAINVWYRDNGHPEIQFKEGRASPRSATRPTTRSRPARR
jgi:hypothetical protein